MQFHMHRQHIQAIQMQIQQLMQQTQPDNLPRNIIKNIQVNLEILNISQVFFRDNSRYIEQKMKKKGWKFVRKILSQRHLILAWGTSKR